MGGLFFSGRADARRPMPFTMPLLNLRPCLTALAALALASLAACTTDPAPGQLPPAKATPTAPQVQTDAPRAVPVPAPATATRDAQGRTITAHFAAPAGEGARVNQADGAGTYRVLLGTLPRNGGFRVQDFFETTGRPFSDAFVLQNEADLTRQPAKSIDGWLRQYHHGGGRRLVQLFRNGEAEGTASTFYPGNKRKSVVIFRNGQPEGVGTFWHSGGELALKVSFRNGRPSEYRGWSPSGEVLDSSAAQAQYEQLRRMD